MTKFELTESETQRQKAKTLQEMTKKNLQRINSPDSRLKTGIEVAMTPAHKS